MQHEGTTIPSRPNHALQKSQADSSFSSEPSNFTYIGVPSQTSPCCHRPTGDVGRRPWKEHTRILIDVTNCYVGTNKRV